MKGKHGVRENTLVKPSLNRFRPPVTRRCEAAHKTVIKKAEVNDVVKTKEGAVAKQVIQKTLKTGISPPPLSSTLPETAPNPNSSISITARQVFELPLFWPDLMFRLSSCTSIRSFRACPRSYCSSTRRRPRGKLSRQRGTQIPARRRGSGKPRKLTSGSRSCTSAQNLGGSWTCN